MCTNYKFPIDFSNNRNNAGSDIVTTVIGL